MYCTSRGNSNKGEVIVATEGALPHQDTIAHKDTHTGSTIGTATDAATDTGTDTEKDSETDIQVSFAVCV